MKELTEPERNAIYLERARSNAAKTSYAKLAIIALIGSDFHIKTEASNYRLKKYLGHLYYVYFK